MRNHCLWIVLAFAGCTDDENNSGADTVARDDHFVIEEDDTGTITGSKLLDNDDNVYSSSSLRMVEEPTHGMWDEYNRKYVPDPGYFGSDRFVYRIDSGATATVTLDITSDGVTFEDSTRLDPTGADALAVGDLDGNGQTDIVVANGATNSIAILVNRTTAPKDYVITPYRFEGGRTPVDIAVADLDNDGRVDIVTASRSEGIVILRNITPPGAPLAFEEPLVIAESSTMATVGVVATDIDGDGRTDLATLLDGSTMYMPAAGVVSVRLGTTIGDAISFGPSTQFATPKEPIDLLATDADEDGTPDLAVLSKHAGELSLFLNATAVGATVPVFGTRIDRATANKPRNMFLADLDGDGDSEIAVMHDLVIWIYANRGAAMLEFEAARVLDLPSAATTSFAAPIDLDGQGAIDLLAVNEGASPMAQLFNNTLGIDSYMFDLVEGEPLDIASRRRAMFGEPRGIAAMDFDGVAPLEIVVATRTVSTNGTMVGGTYIVYER
jgi:hypothetical protein